jgi:hypothetical protein
MGNSPLAGGIAGTVQKLRQNLATASTSSNSRKILIVKEDEPVKVRMLQDPDEWMIFYEHYVPENKAFVPALDPDPLSTHPDEKVRRTSLRHMVNVLNLETMQVQLLKMNQDLTNRFMMRYNRYNTLTDRNYEILRTGSGLQTAYDVEADDAEPMDLTRFQGKLHDMTLFLLQEADRFHGSDFAEEYERNNGSQDSETSQQSLTQELRTEEKAKKKAKADAVVGDPDDISHLENLGDPLPWEEEKKDAEGATPAEGGEDAWLAAKAVGLPCERGEDGKCSICSFDISECLVSKS